MLAIDVDPEIDAAELARRALARAAAGRQRHRSGDDPARAAADRLRRRARRGRRAAGGAGAVSGTELLLPDEMTLRGAGEALAARLQIEDGVSCERERIYYDTFDGLLRDAGLTVMHVDGTLSVTSHDSGIVVASLPMPAPTKPLFARELPPGPLRDALASDHRRSRGAAARASPKRRALAVRARRRAQDGRPPHARGDEARRIERPGRGAAAAPADDRHPRVRQAAEPRAGGARRRARLQARRPAAGR